MKFVSLLTLVACTASTAEPSRVAATQTTGSDIAETSVMVLAPLTLHIDESRVDIDAAGRMTVQQEGVHIEFRSSGEIFVDGERVASVSADGTYRTAQGMVIGQIAEDGSMTFNERSFSFGPDGVLLGTNGHPVVTLSPTDTPAKRLAMSAVILLTF